MAKSEIRKAYLLDKYVIITPGRAKRPRDIKEQSVIERLGSCALCPENVKTYAKTHKKYIKDRLDNQGVWQVISIENIFPALSLDNKKAYGCQEVIVETREHAKELFDLPAKKLELVLRMYARRTRALSRIKDIGYILCFKNQGSKAGASILHAHSQVFAAKLVPPEVREELKAAQLYRRKHGACAYCDIIKKEIKGKRLIYQDQHIAAIAPYASEYHYEAWIFTKRHLDNIADLNNQEFRALAKAYKLILDKLNRLNLSFNCFLHQVISDQDQHFYLKIQPRGSIWAGVELGSGLIINSVAPEKAARYYRK